jgi:hypothetical protein
MSVIPAIWEIEIGRIVVQDQSEGKKLSKTTISTNKLNVVAQACHPSYREGIN